MRRFAVIGLAALSLIPWIVAAQACLRGGAGDVRRSDR